jgi:hypothetical protein
MSLRSFLILSSQLRVCLPSGILPLDFPATILYAFLISPMRAIWSYHLILLFVKSTSYEAPCYVGFSSSHRFFTLRSKYSPQHPGLKTPSMYVLPLEWVSNFHTHTKQQVFRCLDRRWEDKGRWTEWQQASPEFNLILSFQQCSFDLLLKIHQWY